MTTNEGVVRSVSWRDVCPWTLLFRLFRLSVSIQVLLLALLGSCAATAGWRIADYGFLTERAESNAVVQPFVEVIRRWPGQDRAGKPDFVEDAEAGAGVKLEFAPDDAETVRPMIDGGQRLVVLPELNRLVPIIQATPAYGLVEPFRRIFLYRSDWPTFFFYLTGGLWSLLTWCLVGGAITRIAAVRLGRDERVGVWESLGFARRKFASFYGAPLLPLIAILISALPPFVTGLLMRLDMGILLAGIFWIVIGLSGLVMALFGLGLLFGWPLMWSTISSEGTDAFDAISRSYAYTFQRPLHYALYVSLATALGLAGWVVVGLFCDSTLMFINWATEAGTGNSRFTEIQLALSEQGRSASAMLWFGAKFIQFFTVCIRAFQTAFASGYFWVAAAGIYLLLRRDADQTEIDDIFLEEEDELAFGLPPLSPDEAGVPGVTDFDPNDPSVEKSPDA